MIFKIGTTEAGDYSHRVIAGSFNVQTKEVFKTWVDGNGITHRQLIRSTPKTQGTFDMVFPTIEEYNIFVALLEATKANDQTVLCTVKNNNLNTEVTSNFFIDYSPIRDRRGNWDDYMHRFTVNIEEA